MDFSTLNPEAADSEGRWVHVVDPSGKPLYAKEREAKGKWTLTTEETDKPSRFKVLGRYSDAVQSVERKYMRNAMTLAGVGKKKTDAEAMQNSFMAKYIEAQPDAAADVARAAVVDWENIPWDGALIDFDPERMGELAQRSFIREQVREAAQKTADFFEESASD